MPHVQGGKVTSTHTTLTELSRRVVEFLRDCPLVTRIAIGKITSIAESGGSGWSVKIIDESGCVLVKTTQNCTVQELRVYCSRLTRQTFKLVLARFIRDSRWHLKFGNHISC